MEVSNQASYAQYEFITQYIPGGFVIQTHTPDLGYRYKYISAGYASMLGYTEDELAAVSGGCINNIADYEGRKELYADMLDRLLVGEEWIMRYKIRCKDGSWKLAEDRGRKVRSEQGDIEFWSVVIDIDAEARLKKAETALEENRLLAAEQNVQLEEISALNRELREEQEILEESTAEQEAQLEEIGALNRELTEQKNTLTHRLDAIRSLVKIYFAAYYVDVDHDDYYELAAADDIRSGFDPAGKSQATLNVVCDTRIAPEYREAMRRFVDYSTLSARMRDTDTVSMRYRSVAGRWGLARFIAGERHEDGTLKSCTFVLRDISGEIAAEEKHSEELARALAAARESATAMDRVHEVLGSAPWKVEYDEAGKETRVEFSDGLRRLFGYENTEDYPDSLEFMLTLVHPDDYDRVLREIYGTLGSGDAADINISSRYRAYRKDGSIRRYLVQGLVKRRENGTPMLSYGVIQDITEQEKNENARQEALAAFEAVHDALGSGGWQMDFDENGVMTHCRWSDRFRAMLGYRNTEDFPDELASWTDLLHPDDKEAVLRDYWAAVNDRRGRIVYSVRYRLLTKNSGYRWFSAHGSLSRYPDGAPKVYHGVFFDIHEQVMAEQSRDRHEREINALNAKLQENQARLEESAAEQEAQIEEIGALNAQLQDNQAKLEEASAELEAQLEETQALNTELQQTKDSISEAYGMIEGFSMEYHTIWLVDKNTMRMRLIRSNGVSTVQGAVKMAEKIVELDPTVKAYVAAYVEPEDRERAGREMSSGEVLRHLRENPGEIYAVNYLRRDESGHVAYHQIAFANADTADGKKQFVLGFRDVDKIVKAEHEQKEAMRRAKEEAEAANNAKTSFLFNMSHDIRTPMNAIIGFRNLLEKHQEDPARRADYLRKIDDASTVLLSIINNVLEMARIEKGTLEIDETAWSAEQFNDTLYSVFVEMMRQKQLTFTRQIDVQHSYVFCDPIKLREIFINILSNAYKYTNAGGSVNMHLEEVPSDREGYAMYRTTISDTGIGMSEEFLPHLFEEFARENNTTDAKVEGTGLGMPIVKRLVEMLDGTIEVHSKKGEGSTFIVTIPHRIAERSDLTVRAGVEIDPALFDGKHILLAEDNDLNAEIAMEILGEAGFIVERAEDGVICVNMLKAKPAGYYDVILMDIQMPNMNGYEATRAIRTMDDTEKANIKILAMTANAFEEDKREALRAGMNGHLAKPINIPELMRTLAGILG